MIEDTFNDEINLTDTKIQYQDIECDKVIFCSGMDDNSNKYFDWLPFSLVKGEIMEIEPEENFEIICAPREQLKVDPTARVTRKDPPI